jgi:inward rectifier potassium channel
VARKKEAVVSEGSGEKPEQRGASGWLDRRGGTTVQRLGLRSHPLTDLYHSWLSASWGEVMAAVVALYLGANVLFACGYLVLQDGIENLRPGSFWDCFFFSVQTLATIGYGKMVPVSFAANVLVTIEALAGLLGVALITGLLFAKFSRPSARVLWSDCLVVAPQDGVPSLMFRLANERSSQVVEASIRLSLVRAERTAEGEQVRRVHDLKLRRAQTGAFVLSMLAVHPIDEASPLFGSSLEQMGAAGADFIASLSGLDETLGQTVHSRKGWSFGDVKVGVRFEDMMRVEPDGRRVMDLTRIHALKPLSTEQAAAAQAALPETRSR